MDSPFIPIEIPPGLAPDLSDYASKGLWVDGDKIRFRNGLPETIGAWSYLSPGNTVLGVPRGALTWRLLNGRKVMAVGTHQKLYIYRGGAYYDITPIRDTDTAGSDPFSTVLNSKTVTFTLTSHGVEKNTYIRFSGASTVNGLDVNGEWLCTNVPTTDTLTFEHTGQATGTGNGGGASVVYEFDINAGFSSSVPALGFGAGLFGAGLFGGPRSSSNNRLNIRTWSLENLGEDLLASPSEGALYLWDASSDVTTRATLVSQGPTSAIRMIYSNVDRHALALGVDGDPLLMKWPDQGSITNWTASVTSTANTRRLQEGSRIVTAAKTRSEILIWTDTALYGHRYIGQSNQSHATYRIATVEPPIGPNAVAVYDDQVWWLGEHQFYRYSGTVESYPTPISETLSEDIDLNQGDKVFAGTLRKQNEIYWFYPRKPSSTALTENSRYAKLNVKTGAADMGNLARTVWVDSVVYDNPIAGDPSGQFHEHGLLGSVNDTVDIQFTMYKYQKSKNPVLRGPFQITADTEKINRRLRGRHASIKYSGTMECNGINEPWFIESGVFDIANGSQIMFVDEIIPDVKFADRVTIGHVRVNPMPDGEQ